MTGQIRGHGTEFLWGNKWIGIHAFSVIAQLSIVRPTFTAQMARQTPLLLANCLHRFVLAPSGVKLMGIDNWTHVSTLCFIVNPKLGNDQKRWCEILATLHHRRIEHAYSLPVMAKKIFLPKSKLTDREYCFEIVGAFSQASTSVLFHQYWLTTRYLGGGFDKQW